jgi:outer membrane protein assembly factor BamB
MQHQMETRKRARVFRLITQAGHTLKAWALILAIGVTLPAFVLHAGDVDDWPIFRGSPQLTGHVPVKTSGKPERAWTFRAGKAIKSGVVIVGQSVFTTSTDGKVYALDFKTGKKLWEFDTKASIEAPPLHYARTIFVGNEDGRFVALDAKTGKKKWEFKVEGKIIGSANVLTSIKAVVFGCHDNAIYALEAATGKKLWKAEAETFINGTPAVLPSKHVVAGCCDGKLYVLEPKTGKIIKTVNSGSYIAGSAALEKSAAWVGNFGNQFLGVDVERNKLVWKFGDKENGEPFFSSPAVEKDRVVVGNRDGRVYCFLKKTGKKLWSFRTKDEVNSSPLIIGDHVFVGSDDGRLYSLKLINGTKVWDFEIGAGIFSSPSYCRGMLFVGANDGRLYAFKLPAIKK